MGDIAVCEEYLGSTVIRYIVVRVASTATPLTGAVSISLMVGR